MNIHPKHREIVMYTLASGLCASGLLFFFFGSADERVIVSRLRAQISYMRFSEQVTGASHYGTIERIDPATRTLVLRVANRYVRGGADTSIMLRVTDSTRFVRQELLRSSSGDSFDRLSEAVPITLADVRVGERAVVMTARHGETFFAYDVVVGNPL